MNAERALLLSLLSAAPWMAFGQANARPVGGDAAARAHQAAELPDIAYNWSIPEQTILEQLYGPLVHRTFVRGDFASEPRLSDIVSVEGHQLTRTEAIATLETAMSLAGAKVVPVGDGQFKVMANGDGTGGFPADAPNAGRRLNLAIHLQYAPLQAVTNSLAQSNKDGSVIIIVPPGSRLIIFHGKSDDVKEMQKQVDHMDRAEKRGVSATPGSGVRPNATTRLVTGQPMPTPAIRADELANIKYNLTKPLGNMLEEDYSPLLGRKRLRVPNQGPSVATDAMPINLKTQYITKSQAIMVLETVMAINGVTVVPIGNNFYKVALTEEATAESAADFR